MIKPLELTTPLPGYLCKPRSLGKNKTTISKKKQYAKIKIKQPDESYFPMY